MSSTDALSRRFTRAAPVTELDRAGAVTGLVQREAGRLLDYFLRRTASPEDAADLLGETLLIVWRKERSVPLDPTEARMWMFGVARRVLTTQHRSTRRRTALAERLGSELVVAPPVANQLADDLRTHIERLDPTDQEIIRLVYWDGFSLAEAAQILRMQPGTVRSRHARARAKLKSIISAE